MDEDINRYIQDKTRDLRQTSHNPEWRRPIPPVVIEALGGGIQKIKLAIALALKFRNAYQEIVFKFARDEFEFQEVKENIHFNQFIIYRLYAGSHDGIKQYSILQYLREIAQSHCCIIFITDPRSIYYFNTLRNFKIFIIDLEDLQERLPDIDDFQIPAHNPDMMQRLWEQEEVDRERYFQSTEYFSYSTPDNQQRRQRYIHSDEENIIKRLGIE